MKLFEDASKSWNHKFFVTSIYNRRSIVEAFSYGISQFLPKKKSMDYVLKNFVQESNQSGEKCTWGHALGSKCLFFEYGV
jgi:hypothetical protein